MFYENQYLQLTSEMNSTSINWKLFAISWKLSRIMGVVVVVFPRELVVVLFDAVVVNNVELFDIVVNVGWVEELKVEVVGTVELFDIGVGVGWTDGLKVVVVRRVELFDVVVIVVGWVEGLKVEVVDWVELFVLKLLQRWQTFSCFLKQLKCILGIYITLP